MEGLIRRLHRHRWWVFACTILLGGLMGWAASNLHMGQDVTELLPSMDEQDRLAMDILGESTLFDRMYVELSGAPTETLVDVASSLSRRLLEDPRIQDVESRVTSQQEVAAARLVFTHRFHLLSPWTPGLGEALGEEGVKRSLELGKAKMLSPMPGAADRVTRDPLGFADLVRDRMRSSLDPSRMRMHRGFAFTPDLDRCLLVLRTSVRALAVDDAGELVDGVRATARRTVQDEDASDVRVRITGAHLIASQSARAVKGDVMRAFILAAVGIVLIFLVYFRRPSFVLVGLLPSGAGVLAGFATASLVLGKVSGIAVGFGSIVVGISVDYSIHFLRERLARMGDGSAAAVQSGRALAHIFPSLLTGFATTAVVFAFYGLSSFPLIREMGLFAGAGVLTGFLVAILILPLVPVRGKPLGRGKGLPAFLLSPSPGARAVLLGAVIVPTLALALFVPRLRMEDDIRKLDYRSDETARFARQFEKRWLGPRQGLVAIATGGTLQEALETSDRVIRLLEYASIAHTSPSTVLPSVVRQEANVRSLLGRDWTSIRRTLQSQSRSLGFAPGALDPFFEDLHEAAEGEPAPLEREDLAGTPMAHLASGAIVEGRWGAAVITFLPGSSRPERVLDVLGPMDRVMVTSRVQIMNDVFRAVRTEVSRLILLGLLGILMVLVLRYRRLGPALLALLPVLVACVMTAGVFALWGRPVNAIAVLAFTLIVGVGLDYGIFMVDALRLGHGAEHTAGAVLVSGLTTLMSFGVLTTCRNPVLQSTGLVVLVGVLASLAVSLAVVPSVWSLAQDPGWRR